MTEETYRKQAAFAGPKKASMLRRCVGHDYRDRQIYMITMVTEGRRPLFGYLTGRSDASPEAPDAPAICLSPLGCKVAEEWWNCERHHPEISVMALQMMPDHLHGILFVRKQMEQPLGMALRGFKQSCNRHYRSLVLGQAPAGTSVPSVALLTGVPSVALTTQQTELAGAAGRPPEKKDRRGEDRTHGMLFARGYNDRLLLREGQLERWLNYLADNPRRLLMKREHPDLFRVQRNLVAGGQSFSAIGNRFLLDRPELMQVQCSRSMTNQEIEEKVRTCLAACAQGAVLVSPSISAGEKAVMRAAFDKGYPIILLQENGFTDLAKPGGQRMEACARGVLLIIAPWEHHNERTTIRRHQCLTLNEMARKICNKEA